MHPDKFGHLKSWSILSQGYQGAQILGYMPTNRSSHKEVKVLPCIEIHPETSFQGAGNGGHVPSNRSEASHLKHTPRMSSEISHLGYVDLNIRISLHGIYTNKQIRNACKYPHKTSSDDLEHNPHKPFRDLTLWDVHSQNITDLTS